LKTIPFTAAHTYIAHIWQYPPGFRLWLSKKKATNGLQPNCQSIQCVELTEDGVDLGKISSLLQYKSGVNLGRVMLSAMRQIWCAQKEFKQRLVHALSD